MSVDMIVRVGNIDDGGKFLVYPQEMYKDIDCLVYSVGSEGDHSFESSLAQITNKSCEIHTFDPTLGNILTEKMIKIGEQIRMTFHRNGFNQSRDETGIYDNLDGFMQRFGHIGRTINVLKVDCEYCEYSFFPEVFQQIKDKKVDIGIIAVELHDFQGNYLEKIQTFFENADKADMRLYVRDPNVPFCNG